MKKIKIGFLTTPFIILAIYAIVWGRHEFKKDRIIFSQTEIEELNAHAVTLLKHWEKQDDTYLSKGEFLDMLEEKGATRELKAFFDELIKEGRTVYTCDITVAFEVYNTQEPHIFFPENYRHYISIGKENGCPTLNGYDGHDVFKIKELKENLVYKISRHFWD
jgi:uncharacterized protein YprB with RNaseH-like and TPR domain